MRFGLCSCSPTATRLDPLLAFVSQEAHFELLSLYPLSTLADMAALLKAARKDAGLSQAKLAERAGVARTTLARMETLAKGDMSVSALVRLLEAAGYDLKTVKAGHGRTLEDILAEQRSGAGGKP